MRITRTEIIVWGMTAAVILPLLYCLGAAFADGELRRRQTPLRVLLGDDVYDQWASGETTEIHYMGNNRTAPNFTLQDQNNKPWRLSDYRGKIIILNFWTVTCQPCLTEMPSLLRLASMVSHRDDVEVVAISTDAQWSDVKPVFPSQTPLKVLLDPSKKVVQKLFGTKLYPETWIIDAKGIIRLRYDGSRDWSNPIILDVIESLKL
jgi:peroxiredoxin